MFGDGPLTFQEFARREPVPLARIHDALLEFLEDREDAVLIGLHAVNAYVDTPQMTDDFEIVSTSAKELAEELRAYLSERFAFTVRVRPVRGGAGYRLYQKRQPENRHLVELRLVERLPPAQRVEDVLVLSPPDLVADTVMSMVAGQHTPNGMMHWAETHGMLLAFPKLKSEEGPVAERLRAAKAPPEVLAAWKQLVIEEMLPDDEDAGY